MTWHIFLCQKRISNPIVHITEVNYHNKKVVRDMVWLLMVAAVQQCDGGGSLAAVRWWWQCGGGAQRDGGSGVGSIMAAVVVAAAGQHVVVGSLAVWRRRWRWQWRWGQRYSATLVAAWQRCGACSGTGRRTAQRRLRGGGSVAAAWWQRSGSGKRWWQRDSATEVEIMFLAGVQAKPERRWWGEVNQMISKVVTWDTLITRRHV